MKWSLLAIVMGQPLPTGIIYNTHHECLNAAIFFTFDLAGLRERTGINADIAATPNYSCIPAPRTAQ